MTREEAIRCIEKYLCRIIGTVSEQDFVKALDMAIKALNNERPKGRWIGIVKLEDRPSYKWYWCSECEMLVESKVNFCPNCGAKMKGADDE